MSSVWTGMACEAGREERGPKMRDPSPWNLHWSNLEEERKGGREGDEKGTTMCHVCCCCGRKRSLTRAVLLRGSGGQGIQCPGDHES